MSKSVPLAASGGNKEIQELNSNDVLLGRGPGLSNYEGNVRFHKLVKERKKLYTATASRLKKSEIARQVVDLIHDRGGRFLKQNDPATSSWWEVHTNVAEEKAKQALREKYVDKASTKEKKRKEDDGVSVQPEKNSSAQFPVLVPDCPQSQAAADRQLECPSTLPIPELGMSHAYSESASSTTGDLGTAAATPVSPSRKFETTAPPIDSPILSAQNTGPSIVDPRLLLFQGVPSVLNQQGFNLQSLLLTNPALHSQLTNSFMNNPFVAAQIRLRLLQDFKSQASLAATALHQQYSPTDAAVNNVHVVTETESTIDDEDCPRLQNLHLKDDGNAMEVEEESLGILQQAQDTTTEDELAAFLLSSLAVTGRKIITSEEEAKEKASLTDEEKAAALVDAFGKMCESDVPRKKRARRDLDPDSISFLVRQMKCEIERIPANKKRALMEAQAKCSTDDFSDARLEKFLRCEGMNAQMAAQRFVKYWKRRRDVFGAEKFTLPMTLSGALRDDLVALQQGVYSLLPKSDASGRQITYLETRRHTMDGYDSDSLMRAFWYVVEVTASENCHISSGIVQIVWFKGATIWDYDKVYDQMADYYSNCFPIKVLASHLCCPPKVVTRVIQPIVHSFMSKEFRARTLTHDVPDSDILQVLSSYGLEREMLPSAMGGSVTLNQAEWIAHRRAKEMEEEEI